MRHYIFIFILLIQGCTFFNRTANILSPQEANSSSMYLAEYHQGHELGTIETEINSYDSGYYSGVKKGEVMGEKFGEVAAINNIIDSMLIIQNNLKHKEDREHIDGLMSTREREKHDSIKNENQTNLMYAVRYQTKLLTSPEYKEAFRDYYKYKGYHTNNYTITNGDNDLFSFNNEALHLYRFHFEKGVHFCQNTPSDAPLHILEGQLIGLKRKGWTPDNFGINYSKLSKKLYQCGSNTAEDKTFFSETIYKIHIEVIRYIMLRCQLYQDERDEMITEYNKLHNKIVNSYYSSYMSIYNPLKNKYDNQDYHPFTEVYATEVFIDIITTNLSSLMDVLFRIVKKNSEYSQYSRLVLIGEISEIIIPEFITNFKNYADKAALYNAHSKIRPYTENALKHGFTNIILETVIDDNKISKKVTVQDDYEANITMSVKSTYQIAIDTSKISVDVNHKKHLIKVYIPPFPVILRIINQSYEVHHIYHTIKYVETTDKDISKYGLFEKKPKNEINSTIGSKRVILPESIILSVFNSHKPNMMDLQKNLRNLSKDHLDLLVPIITRLIEPTISRPNTCYGVDLILGKKNRTLYADRFYIKSSKRLK